MAVVGRVDPPRRLAPKRQEPCHAGETEEQASARRAALDRIAAARKRGEATRHGRRAPVDFGDDDWVLLMGNLAPDEGSAFADPNYVPTEQEAATTRAATRAAKARESERDALATDRAELAPTDDTQVKSESTAPVDAYDVALLVPEALRMTCEHGMLEWSCRSCLLALRPNSHLHDGVVYMTNRGST